MKNNYISEYKAATRNNKAQWGMVTWKDLQNRVLGERDSQQIMSMLQYIVRLENSFIDMILFI